MTGTIATAPRTIESRTSTMRLAIMAALSSGVVENVRSGVPSSSSSSTRARTCGKKSRTRRVLTPISSQRRKRSSIFGRSPRSTARRTSSTLNSVKTRGKSASVPRYGDAVRGRRLARLDGLLADEPEELESPPGVVADELRHRRGARRVADEDDGPEVEAEGAYPAGHEADRDALGDEEQEVHGEERGEERARDEVPAPPEDDEREEHGPERARFARRERPRPGAPRSAGCGTPRRGRGGRTRSGRSARRGRGTC